MKKSHDKESQRLNPRLASSGSILMLFSVSINNLILNLWGDTKFRRSGIVASSFHAIEDCFKIDEEAILVTRMFSHI